MKNYKWKIVCCTSRGYDAPSVIEDAKVDAMLKAGEAMPWLSKAFLKRCCFRVHVSSIKGGQ